MTIMTDSMTNHQPKTFNDLLDEFLDHEHVRSLVDVAGAITFTAWEQQAIAEAVASLTEELETRQPGAAVEAAVSLIHTIVLSAVTFGAVHGFMLARTSMEAERGWERWLSAARDRLLDAGYLASAGTASMATDITQAIESLQ